MKKAIYGLALSILLLIPFGVNAADYAIPEYNDENVFISFFCNGSELIGTNSKTCNIILGKKEANKELKVKIETNDTLKFKYNGEERSALELVAENNTDRQNFSFEVKSESAPLKEEVAIVNISVSYDGSLITCEGLQNQSFILKPSTAKPSEEENKTPPKEEKNPTTDNIKTANKKIINPNTADKNVFLLATLAMFTIFVIGLTYKKIKQK